MEVLWLLVGMALGSSFSLAIAGRFPRRTPDKTEISAIPNPAPINQLEQQLETLQAWHESHHSQLNILLERGSEIGPERSPTPPEDSETVSSPPDQSPPASNPLASDVGIDYGPLNQSLGMGQWAAADQMTRELLATSVGVPANGVLTPDDWQRVPETDLRTMDNLWRYWSGDRFGFTVQAQLWCESGANYEKFCDRVGWRQGDGWIYRDELQGDRSAPVGHWPAIAWGTRACYGHGAGVASQGMSGLMDRAIALFGLG
ncbi:MAG: GUN4 domain-containing protein [Cyanobacteria bacterium P01_H01_bin.130]